MEGEERLPPTPYKGLVPYSEEDAPFFFGRDAECEIITANLLASRLTVLYGTTGVGKSSVLRAGVAHRLRQQAQENLVRRGAPEFAVLVFSSWGDDPVAGLASLAYAAVERALGVPWSEPMPASRSLLEVLRTCTERLGGDLLIILDQFEEYFLYHGEEDGEGTFAVEFPRAVNRRDLRVSFLTSIREDALAKLDRFKGRIPNLFNTYLRLQHLDYEAGRAAIEKPLAQFNRLLASGEAQVFIEPALIEAVLEQVKTGQVMVGETGRGASERDLAGTQVEAPYLQLVMSRLWDEEMRCGSRLLRLETLQRLGGAERIVQTHLDVTMGALSAQQQDHAAQVFRFLVTPSGTKIAHTVRDLTEYAGVPAEELETVVNRLSAPDVRILRPIPPPPGQSGLLRYEIFHDVLAAAILDWRTRYVQAQERAAAGRQLTRARRRVARLTLGLVGVSLLLIAVAVLALFAVRQQRIATAQGLLAQSVAQLPLDPELSLLLAIESVRLVRTSQAEDVLRWSLAESHVVATLLGHTDLVRNAVFSPDGRLLATASLDGTTQIWETSSSAEAGRSSRIQLLAMLRGHRDAVNNVAFSPDGTLLVTASRDKTARVWDVTTGQLVVELAGHSEALITAVFSPDGKHIVTASLDKTARVWEAATGKTVAELRGHSDGVLSASFSPDGRWVLTAGQDGLAKVWQASTGAVVADLRGHTGQVRAAAFSPDGRFVVTAGADKTAQVWEAATGREVTTLRGHEDWVFGAAWNPAGDLIVTASGDGTARVWDAATGVNAAVLYGHSDYVMAATFSVDGKYIVTAGDTTARVWDAGTGEALAVLRGHTGQVQSAMFSPDGKWVSTASADGTARIWAADARSSPVEIGDPATSIWDVAYSPDGQTIAAAMLDGTARLWDAASGQLEARFEAHADYVYDVSFSPDGQLLVTASEDGTARVWDVATGQTRAELAGHSGPVLKAVFSPDGTRIVTVSVDGTARVWKVPTGDSVVELRGHADAVIDAAFSPDGKQVLTGSRDGTARIWDAATGATVAELRGHRGQVWSVAFSPDGLLVATASLDGTARVWDSATGAMVAELRGHVRDVYSAVFSPDGQRVVTASADHMARIWEAKTGRPLLALRGHTDSVLGATFSWNGKFVVTAGQDGTARIWEASTARPLAIMRGDSDWVYSAAFSPDARFVLTLSQDGEARVYPCDVCGSLDELLILARERVTRELACQERRLYLHQNVTCATPT
jgi:WD40 repeat protein